MKRREKNMKIMTIQIDLTGISVTIKMMFRINKMMIMMIMTMMMIMIMIMMMMMTMLLIMMIIIRVNMMLINDVIDD